MGRPGRLPNYDYSSAGCYFVTFCTRNRREVLSQIVGRDDLGAPQIVLLRAGQCLEQYIQSISEAYPNVSIDQYTIMPNHVHLLISVREGEGAPGSSRPTQLIPRIISVLKRYTNRDMGENIWQSTYHDHIIRSEEEYLEIWDYIDTNPAQWTEDCYYREV